MPTAPQPGGPWTPGEHTPGPGGRGPPPAARLLPLVALAVEGGASTPGAALPPDLDAWLCGEGLEGLRSCLAREGICLGAVRLLTEADLDRLGLPLGPHVRLRDAVRRLRAAGAGAGAGSGGPSRPKASAEGCSDAEYFSGEGPGAARDSGERAQRWAGSADSEAAAAAAAVVIRPQCGVCSVS